MLAIVRLNTGLVKCQSSRNVVLFTGMLEVQIWRRLSQLAAWAPYRDENCADVAELSCVSATRASRPAESDMYFSR